ncbi:MAG TPA: phosphohistidine phosphatase SixA [Nitrospiraceae bacterium]|nr:phosphohistidine phosphatase SixA [Nitrospiraceae bacterium]
MLLYLVQHAEAKREEEDPARGLTDKGLQDIKNVGNYVAGLKIKVGQIFHSGKTRALQTAQILADYLEFEKELSQTDGLSPMDDPQIWFERISQTDEDTILVGHMPHLGRLAGFLLCGDKDSGPINFKMAGIVCLRRFDDGHWAAEWMITPEVVK